MTKELDRHLDEAAVARGGLLSRRRLMSGSLALGGAVAAGSLGMIETAQAAPALPGWAKVAGLPVRGYGMPAEQEAHVKRAVLQFYKELAPEYSFSGTPLQHLRGTITPSGLHFEVHHGGRPELDPAAHRLMIHGLVERPLKFDLASLERYPMVSRVHFIECSGNSFFNALFPEPMQAGCDVLHGLVSNSEWSGIPLSILMDEAGVKPDGRWVIATGDDGPSLGRSIPMEKVMGDGMLALYQNGERLRPEQGYPMRLLLPGYEGNMHIKWVTSLWVTDAPAHTKDESGEYTDLRADGKTDQFSFPMDVKSVITHPSATMSMERARAVRDLRSRLVRPGSGRKGGGVGRRRRELGRGRARAADSQPGDDPVHDAVALGRLAGRAAQPGGRRHGRGTADAHGVEAALCAFQLQPQQRDPGVVGQRRRSGRECIHISSCSRSRWSRRRP